MLNLQSYKRHVRLVTCLMTGVFILPMEGCAVAALPCRLVSATLKIVPAVGHAAAAPFDTCADAID
ncbi:DUF6726 family protein [Caballeronia sordidicola]|jgi:hypothetical protein|uniref:Uncharacterized protein n=1 Tax=Caballeronia sordidicola TaxID=196367 RepID=A0A226WTL3_CABSO|nr:DUF6726 family protein [Caballeronia sordidicola]OXC74150.1 hypothetical protein BSU04_33045 [Caballeronia sordidicola]